MAHDIVNILLVDDKIENLVALESLLEAPGYRLVRALNAEQALLALLEREYAAIVLDVEMPGMSGIELARMIRARKKMWHVPILFLTAYGDHSAISGYEAGGVDFLTKPFLPDVLRFKVAVFAELFRTSAALRAEIEERARAEERIVQLNKELAGRVNELAAANAELEAFSYTLSHDLRAPLRHMSGFVALLRDNLRDRQTAEDAEYMRMIDDAARRMAGLIDDMLAFFRVSEIGIKRNVVDLAQLVVEAIETLAPVCDGRDVRWKIHPLPKVDGDSAMLRQVITSLLDNALKFTRPRACAEIEIGGHAKDGEHVLFVRDNGVGFDPQHADKLFGVFQRLHADAEFEGTGIGLASVRRIVRRHNGRTWAESTLGEGTTVYFALPV